MLNVQPILHIMQFKKQQNNRKKELDNYYYYITWTFWNKFIFKWINILKILVNKYIDKYLSNISSDIFISTQGWYLISDIKNLNGKMPISEDQKYSS